MRRSLHARSAFVFGCILGACAQIASADVTTQQRISIDGLGGMKIANMSGTTTTIISGERARIESSLQLQSKIVRMFARDAAGPRVDIVRLDLGKIDHLDVAKKEYTETTFEQMRAQQQQLVGQAGVAQPREEALPTPIDDSQCEWSDPKAEVRRSGERATVAGFDAERLTITASQACKDKHSGQVCEFVLVLDEWLAPKFAASAEAQKYTRAYARQMGLTTGTATSSRDIAERAQSMFGRYKGIWSEFASKTKDMKGYPVKTTFAFAVGGPQCQSTQQANAPASSASDSTGSQPTSPPANPADVAAQISGKLSGLFHKKSDNPAPAEAGAPPAPAAAAPMPDGLLPVITLSSEILSVSTAAADPSVFEIPADFKKIVR
ncbi:MAG TPA: hypothetical protein VK820_01110 [Steroidobacteraceae bacterium]|jgi:hypothetical protein|nr:hypothetical protein [Steroidobacteraceae bacterium]